MTPVKTTTTIVVPQDMTNREALSFIILHTRVAPVKRIRQAISKWIGRYSMIPKAGPGRKVKVYSITWIEDA